MKTFTIKKTEMHIAMKNPQSPKRICMFKGIVRLNANVTEF